MTQKALLVLGMHRSGTSAVTGIFNMLGIDLGKNLLQGLKENPKGHYENQDFLRANKRLLEALHITWSSVGPFPHNWWLNEEVLEIKAEINQVLATDFAHSEFWGVKDPRLCRVLPLWKEILSEINCRPYFVHVIRNPIEIAASLHRRDGLTTYHSLLLWFEHIIEAELETRGFPRVFVTYSQILEDWAVSVDRIASTLGINWPKNPSDAAAQIDEFLTPKLRHHAVADETLVDKSNIPAFVIDAHKELVKASQGYDRDLVGVLERCRSQLDDSTGANLSILAKMEESYRESRLLLRHLARKDTQIRQKDDQIRQKDAQIQQKDTHIKQQSDQIRQKDAQIQQKDTHIKQQSDQIRQKDAQIQQKDALIRQKDAQIASSYQSLSWRITAPLRAVGRLTRRRKRSE